MAYWRPCAHCGNTYSPQASMAAADYKWCSFKCRKASKISEGNPRLRPTTYRSRRQERRTALEGGGRQVLASGALPGRKGDVVLSDWLVECKTTGNKSYRFKKEDWQSHCIDASLVGRKPVFEINLDGEELIVVSRREFFSLIKE